MDFIERWLHISPDGGNGMSEILVLSSVALTLVVVAGTALRRRLPRRLIEFAEQFGKQKDSDLFGN